VEVDPLELQREAYRRQQMENEAREHAEHLRRMREDQQMSMERARELRLPQLSGILSLDVAHVAELGQTGVIKSEPSYNNVVHTPAPPTIRVSVVPPSIKSDPHVIEGKRRSLRLKIKTENGTLNQ